MAPIDSGVALFDRSRIIVSSSSDTRTENEQTDEQKQWRRRLQNRRNQRNRRAQAKESRLSSLRSGNLQFQVDRWRIEEHGGKSTCADMAMKRGQSRSTSTDPTDHECTLFPISVEIPCGKDFQLPLLSLPVDGLLNLIHYNVCRGLNMNKTTLNSLAVNISQRCKSPVPIKSDQSFYGLFVIKPTAGSIPNDLVPTRRQLNRAHANWVNFLPYSEIRDNMIQWHDRFDHRDFAKDVLGTDLVGAQWFRDRKSSKEIPSPKKTLSRLANYDDEMTTERQGLILWGEPHLKGSWEATPGFLRKWMWAVEGCEDLITSTNLWRMNRGEEKLYLEDV